MEKKSAIRWQNRVMPKPTPAHEALQRLIGTWEGQEKLFDSAYAPSGSAAARVTYRAALGGLAVVQDYTQTRADGSVFELHGLITIDPQVTKSGDSQPDDEVSNVVWYSFDSYLPAPDSPARGHWYGSTLGLEKTTPRGRVRHRITVAGDYLNHVIATCPPEGGDDDFRLFMDGTYRRCQPV